MASTGDSIVNDCLEFSFKLYNSCAELQNKNILISPFSIFTALGMVLFGAKGVTADEMKKVLCLNNREEMLTEFSKLISYVNTEYITDKLNIANKIYLQQGISIKTDFASLLKETFHVESGTVDFANNSAKDLINSWVSYVTKEKITEIINELDVTTHFIIVSAIYFKGFWATKFFKGQTEIIPFHLDSKQSVDVEMMYQKGKYGFKYDAELKCSILELPYDGNTLSMIIFLPDGQNNLKNIEQKLNSIKLDNIMVSVRKEKTKIHIWLPKFKLKETLDLKYFLSKMGIKELFIPGKADLSDIVERENLHVESIIHNAFIEINEEGTEAAASTAVRIQKRSLDVIPEFRADHPFLFLVTENIHNTILFLGALKIPTAAIKAHDEL